MFQDCSPRYIAHHWAVHSKGLVQLVDKDNGNVSQCISLNEPVSHNGLNTQSLYTYEWWELSQRVDEPRESSH